MSKREFVIHHVFKNVSDMEVDDFWNSDWEEHLNVKWKLRIERNNGSDFGFRLFTCFDSSVQSVLAKHKHCIISKIGEVLKEKTGEAVFGENGYWGWPKFTNWKTLTENYLIDGDLKVEAHVTILEMTGFPRRSFGEDAKKFSDVALVVKGQKFYVSKLFLSSQSEYFETLFMGPFKESGKSEIELKEIEPNDLQNFLELIYGDPSLDDKTVEGILSIVNMYITKNVVQKCEKFLLEKSEKELKEKLILAGKYKLEELKETCMEKIKSVVDVRKVAPSDENEMDKEIVTSLLRKVLSLV